MLGLSLTLDERLGGHLLRPTAFQYCSISKRGKPSFQMQVEGGVPGQSAWVT